MNLTVLIIGGIALYLVVLSMLFGILTGLEEVEKNSWDRSDDWPHGFAVFWPLVVPFLIVMYLPYKLFIYITKEIVSPKDNV